MHHSDLNTACQAYKTKISNSKTEVMEVSRLAGALNINIKNTQLTRPKSRATEESSQRIYDPTDRQNR